MSATALSEAERLSLDAAWADTALPTDWPPPEVIDACGLALRRLEGPKLVRIGVTSCHRGEGRSTVAAAIAAIQRFVYGRSTVLAELDLRRPAMAKRFGIPKGAGAADLLRGAAPLEQCLHRQADGFTVLSSGDVTGATSGLAVARSGRDLLDSLGVLCDVVVSDLPALEEKGAAVQVSELCSTILLVVRAGSTSLREARRAADVLGGPVPVVLNQSSSAVPRWLRPALGG